MAIKGSLKEASLADVCQLLSLGFKSGCLSVADRSRFGQIYFDRGRISYARIINRRDRLGDMLLRDGALTQEQLGGVLEEQERDPDHRVGELLVERGLLTRVDLVHYVRLQIEEAIFHLFTWSRGNFFFEAGERPEAADILVSINPESLLLEAARRVDEWSLIEQKITSLDLIFEVEHERLRTAGLEVSDEQKQLLRWLDGARSVQEIADASGLSEFEAGKALFGLVQAGFAHRVGRKQEEPVRSRTSELAEHRNLGQAFFKTAMFEDAAREFRRVLELSPQDVVARFHLALISLRESRHEEAVRLFKLLLEQEGAQFPAFMNLAVAMRALGRSRDVLMVLDEAEALQPAAALVALMRGVIRLEQRRVRDAAAHFEEYRRRLGEYDTPAPQYFYFAGLAAALAGDLEGADTLMREGLGFAPESPPLLLLAGLVHERRGELDEAEKLYREVVEKDATIVQAHKNLGDIALRRGAHEQALHLYHRAIELSPDLGDDVYARLGNLHYRARNRDAAVRYWNRALEINPGNDVVRNNLEMVEHAVV